MRIALAITLSLPTALYAQPAPVEPAPAEPTTPASPTEPATPTPQPTPAGKPAKTIGIDAAGILPLSDYADDATVGLGVLVRYVIPRSEVFALTLRTGGLFHVAAENRDTLLLFPALFGIQLRISDRWSFTGDAGMLLRYQGEAAAAAGLTLGVGYRSGKFHLGGELLVPDLGLADSTAGVMFTVGYVP